MYIRTYVRTNVYHDQNQQFEMSERQAIGIITPNEFTTCLEEARR